MAALHKDAGNRIVTGSKSTYCFHLSFMNSMTSFITVFPLMWLLRMISKPDLSPLSDCKNLKDNSVQIRSSWSLLMPSNLVSQVTRFVVHLVNLHSKPLVYTMILCYPNIINM